MAPRSLSQVAAPKTVYGTSLVIISGSIKDSIWHFARYHKWQHQRQYTALRALSQVAAPKTVHGTLLVITNGSTKERVTNIDHVDKVISFTPWPDLLHTILL
jgi:hypothetical protein